MFRNVDRMEGGPGDPKNVREWWTAFKGWPARVLLAVGCIFLVAVVFTLVDQLLHP